jgi:hypothetical protein
MGLQSDFFSKNRWVVLIWSLWFISTATLFVTQSLELFGYGDPARVGPHPEIPGSDPETTLSVIAACNARVGSGDTLCVAYQDSDPKQLFITYRLAYVLYPRRITSLPYSEGTLPVVIHQLEVEYHPTLLLAFAGPEFAAPTGLHILARLPLNAYLLQPATSRNP